MFIIKYKNITSVHILFIKLMKVYVTVAKNAIRDLNDTLFIFFFFEQDTLFIWLFDLLHGIMYNLHVIATSYLILIFYLRHHHIDFPKIAREIHHNFPSIFPWPLIDILCPRFSKSAIPFLFPQTSLQRPQIPLDSTTCPPKKKSPFRLSLCTLEPTLCWSEPILLRW